MNEEKDDKTPHDISVVCVDIIKQGELIDDILWCVIKNVIKNLPDPNHIRDWNLQDLRAKLNELFCLGASFGQKLEIEIQKENLKKNKNQT